MPGRNTEIGRSRSGPNPPDPLCRRDSPRKNPVFRAFIPVSGGGDDPFLALRRHQLRHRGPHDGTAPTPLLQRQGGPCGLASPRQPGPVPSRPGGRLSAGHPVRAGSVPCRPVVHPCIPNLSAVSGTGSGELTGPAGQGHVEGRPGTAALPGLSAPDAFETNDSFGLRRVVLRPGNRGLLREGFRISTPSRLDRDHGRRTPCCPGGVGGRARAGGGAKAPDRLWERK